MTEPTATHSDPSMEFTTIRDFIRFAVSRFNGAGLVFGHGSDNAYDEAIHLIMHSLHLPSEYLESFFDARLSSTEKHALVKLIRRRIDDRIPTAYLIGEAWLSGYRFRVDERVIVPRSFIAELLGEQLMPWIDYPDKVLRILDLCTGSGCLAILAALAFPAAKVDAVDLSTDALAVARLNVNEYGLQDRVRLVHSDLFEGIENEKYDLIISNPPYVTAEAMDALPREYRAEPRMALSGGNDGLDVVQRILRQSERHLEADGILVVEIGHNRPMLEKNYPQLPFTWLDTAAGNDYVFMLSCKELAGLQ